MNWAHIHRITDKSRSRNWLKRKKKFSRLILIPTKTVGSLNRNRKNQKSRKKRKNLKKKRKRNIKKINEIKKTWFYMFIINFKVLGVKIFHFYVLNFILTDSKCRSHIYFRWVKRPTSKLSIVQRPLFRLMKESSKKKARIIFPFESV